MNSSGVFGPTSFTGVGGTPTNERQWDMVVVGNGVGGAGEDTVVGTAYQGAGEGGGSVYYWDMVNRELDLVEVVMDGKWCYWWQWWFIVIVRYQIGEITDQKPGGHLWW